MQYHEVRIVAELRKQGEHERADEFRLKAMRRTRRRIPPPCTVQCCICRSIPRRTGLTASLPAAVGRRLDRRHRDGRLGSHRRRRRGGGFASLHRLGHCLDFPVGRATIRLQVDR
jgi:hypothetical protein